MLKTTEELEKLKKDWSSDPYWDIENTNGFEEYKEELLEYRFKCQSKWNEERLEKENEKLIDKEAETLGIKGLYRILKEHNEILKRHERAIELLSDGKDLDAYKMLKGYYSV